MGFKQTAILALFLAEFALGASDSLVWGEFKPWLATDFGHIVTGENDGQELEFQPLNRNTVVLGQSAVYEKWTFDAGFKAIIWWPFQAKATQPHERTIRVEPRVSQVKAMRALGEQAYVEFGFFPYKYNPDAQNLGEYLYRSGTYPGVIRTTDGLNLMNYALYEAYGVHFRVNQLEGRIAHDFNVFSQPTSIPIGDLTPAYELSVKTPLVEFGAGAAYNRLITYNSKATRPKDVENGYFEVDTGGAAGPEFMGPYALAPDDPPGSATSIQGRIKRGDSSVTVLHYYTQKGVKLMARVALDLGGLLLPEHLRNPGDLRFFAEVALLGMENQPFYYEDQTERMPVMFGVNLPTCRLLDLLSVQAEYYSSPFRNSYEFDYFARPVWTISQSFSPYHRDDWKWSVNARKKVNRLLTLQVQVANDYLRLPEFTLNTSSTPLTIMPENWYYLLRLESRF